DFRRERGAVADADLLQHVRDVALDRFPGEEELPRDLGIASAFRDQLCDRALPVGQCSDAHGAALPGANTQRAKPLRSDLGDGLRAASVCTLDDLAEDILGARRVTGDERASEIEARP